MSPEQLLYQKKLKRYNLGIRAVRLSILFLILAGWQLAAYTGLINAFIFSSPIRILRCAADLGRDGSLQSHITITVLEVLSSFLLVAGISLLAAVALWWNRTLCEILEPYLVILNSLPKSAMAPIFIVWLGNNMKTIIVTAISVAVFGSILNLFTDFASTDPDKLKLIRTLGGTRLHCLTKVVLPVNLPSIISIMKVDIGLCLIGVVIGEFLSAKRGLGYLIIYGSQVFKMDWVMLSIILLCLIAGLLYLGISLVEKRFLSRRH